MQNEAEINGVPAPDERWMEEALRLARLAELAGEVPVGAVVVCDGRIVGRGWNQVVSASDPCAHAEIQALREAARNARQLPAQRLPALRHSGALRDVRRSHRPCPHLPALSSARAIPRPEPSAASCKCINHPRLNHRMEVTEGVLAGRCMEILQAFFRERRG